MNIAKIDELLRNIIFDKFYLEATFQFKLLMQLAKVYDEDGILLRNPPPLAVVMY